MKDKEEKIINSNSKMSEETSNHEEIIIGGIEGGGTHSSLIIMDGKGNQLAHIKGPGTNHWGLGIKETALRINNMIVEAKETLNISESRLLDCVGLCLSGCEEEETNNQLVETLLKEFPHASKKYVVGSDSMGSLKTGSNCGGIVLIAGTGSNGLLINSDGSTHGCGGWGHMIGDEGGAFWIAHRACKCVFDDLDGLQKAPHSTEFVWTAMKKFFRVNNQNEMLPHLYSNFDKSKFAMFTKELVAGCEKKDPLCESFFTHAGEYLARYVNTLAAKAHNDVKLATGGLKVICVGSVWKSWNLMEKGFTNEIKRRHLVDELTLLRLKAPSAIGACYVAGEKISCESLVKTHDKNSEAFFHYKRGTEPKKGTSVVAIDNSCETICVAAS
ncbi:N-acetyl-D-glucosamine kinase [Microplitis mediator]|uniref:N-acetyl-D-glucosamine kinase n=1 Tax=Microplitis mediator TaxID=375433 RepID=UPI00255572F7|nr:N-acetyl-D-glucosamine kinase [Microplitis mediator]XP_057340086.1 N-acetyl-D-glucosamine kinase [Microplitis mediator]XP_057340087.1 N-acetyl-D-glucosamine kinase [Microplitis mediator]